ncbi:conserved membrane hypothetical protein [Nostocoides japonicum T1-X7]|uniref:Uncharacterized protein n=1 Tax=Nostocoides japonicum T1-X7 TaxID=1194083 RepID=A0A077LWJ3_9MICO|nr:hypothetical protein [Tetrasphaera japonica]CCH77162.1 conserved membrane hypothetical protein [Tetrasphaera japonica T1-X7]
MIDGRFVLLGALLTLIGSSRYAWLTIHARTRPNRVTWCLWAAAPIIGFLAQLDEGVGLPSVLTLSVGLGPSIVFASTFVNPQSYWRISRFDLCCGAVSLAALVVWLTLDNPTLAVVFAVVADAMAGVPTIVKAWRAPETENPVPFLLAGLNGTIAMLTIDDWGIATWAFPAYIVVMGLGLSVLIATRQRRVGAVTMRA